MMTLREELARRRCYEVCSKGYFSDPENGCFGPCSGWRDCESWRVFTVDLPEMPDKEG